MGVPVEDGLRAMRPDRPRESTGPEERPDPLRLADEGVRDRCVVEEHDTPLAAGDRLEPGLERLDLLVVSA